MTTVDNSVAQGIKNGRLSGGEDTQDRIFLLSYAEAWKYFTANGVRVSSPTAYARAVSVSVNKWWLRSPGKKLVEAAQVSTNGTQGTAAVTHVQGVRPAMWVDAVSLMLQ